MSRLYTDLGWPRAVKHPKRALVSRCSCITYLFVLYFFVHECYGISLCIARCDMAFIEPMHRNKPNITYLLTLCIAIDL